MFILYISCIVYKVVTKRRWYSIYILIIYLIIKKNEIYDNNNTSISHSIL